MAQYLDKFNDLIRKRQAEQILRLLNKQKNSGQIRTIEEFTGRLDSLIRELTGTTLTPSLKLFKAEENDVTDSETFNFMLDRLQDDLEAAFEEATNIDEVQKSHTALVRDVILKNLRYGIAELESKVALYKFLSRDTSGFDSAIFSTFRESREARTTRAIDQSDSIFLDPRTNQLIDPDQDALIDPVGERLVLGTDNKIYHDVRTIRQIFDSESPQSSLVVEPPNSKLQNLLDGTTGTYWIQSLLFEEQKQSVKVKIELELGGTRDINFIEIEPANRFGVTLESIYYLDGNNVILKLTDPELVIASPVTVQFRSITTKKVILVFRNDHSRKVQFEYNTNSDTLYNQAISEPTGGHPSDMTKLSKDLRNILNSSKIKNILNLPLPKMKQFMGYEFQTGFDNIRLGIATYKPKSIYVSSILNVDNVGQIGLKTIEARPASTSITANPAMSEVTYDTEDAIFFHSSIEYWVIKRDLDEDGNIVSTSRFPILPIGSSRVHHERLVLTEKSTIDKIVPDVGSTMFFTKRVAGEVKVYRNGVLLLSVDDIPTVSDGWVDESTSDDSSPNSGTRMKMKIRIQNPLPGDVFTVTYTTLLSNTLAVPKTLSEYSSSGLNIVDMIGDLTARIFEGQLILVDKPSANANRIVKSAIFLAIIIRNNTADPALSASVEEYTLVAGHKDQSKFVELEE